MNLKWPGVRVTSRWSLLWQSLRRTFLRRTPLLEEQDLGLKEFIWSPHCLENLQRRCRSLPRRINVWRLVRIAIQCTTGGVKLVVKIHFHPDFPRSYYSYWIHLASQKEALEFNEWNSLELPVATHQTVYDLWTEFWNFQIGTWKFQWIAQHCRTSSSLVSQHLEFKIRNSIWPKQTTP